MRDGSIELADLVTLRQGELAWDQPSQSLRPLAAEIVKIRGVAPNSWRCVFFDAGACAVYATRPAECRALACWDTAAIEAMYTVGRVRRGDILPAGASLSALIEEHETRCAYAMLEELARDFKAGCAAASAALVERVRYDHAVRELVSERAAATLPGLAAALDFLFGRPLEQTLVMYGLGVRRSGSAFSIVRARKKFEGAVEAGCL